jgi:hypothetical protein
MCCSNDDRRPKWRESLQRALNSLFSIWCTKTVLELTVP